MLQPRIDERLTFEAWNGWKWFPGMSMTLIGILVTLSHPSRAHFGLVRSANQTGTSDTPGGLNPSELRSITKGGHVPPVVKGSYRPNILAFCWNWRFRRLPRSLVPFLVSSSTTASINEEDKGVWLTGPGESIRTIPRTRTPLLASCREVSYAAIPPNDQPVHVNENDRCLRIDLWRLTT